MRFQALSDLHLEFYDDYGLALINGLPVAAEVLVLAGDVFRLSAYYRVATDLAITTFLKRWKVVIFTPGNHEFWDTSVEDGYEFLDQLMLRHGYFHVLKTGAPVVIDGQRFLGDTMWFPQHPNNFKFEAKMPDFRRIDGLKKSSYSNNAKFKGWLRKECKTTDVVVSHHLPSNRSVPPLYHNSQINRFFVSAMDPDIEKLQPALWIHGHTHNAFDYKIGSTRIVCNPKGYPGQWAYDSNGFKPDLVIDTEQK